MANAIPHPTLPPSDASASWGYSGGDTIVAHVANPSMEQDITTALGAQGEPVDRATLAGPKLAAMLDPTRPVQSIPSIAATADAALTSGLTAGMANPGQPISMPSMGDAINARLAEAQRAAAPAATGAAGLHTGPATNAAPAEPAAPPTDLASMAINGAQRAFSYGLAGGEALIAAAAQSAPVQNLTRMATSLTLHDTQAAGPDTPAQGNGVILAHGQAGVLPTAPHAGDGKPDPGAPDHAAAGKPNGAPDRTAATGKPDPSVPDPGTGKPTTGAPDQAAGGQLAPDGQATGGPVDPALAGTVFAPVIHDRHHGGAHHGGAHHGGAHHGGAHHGGAHHGGAHHGGEHHGGAHHGGAHHGREHHGGGHDAAGMVGGIISQIGDGAQQAFSYGIPGAIAQAAQRFLHENPDFVQHIAHRIEHTAEHLAEHLPAHNAPDQLKTAAVTGGRGGRG